MKTLDQIDTHVAQAGEKRIPISSLPFTITAPGSYYLTGNLTGVLGQDGITISAIYVTIDLNGFTLTGVAGSLNGITAFSGTNLRVSNGTVQGWGKNGINCFLSHRSLFDHLHVENNAVAGLGCGSGSVLSDIVAQSNSGIGIDANTYCILTRCNASGNGPMGISARDGSRVINCTGAFNQSGIYLGPDGMAQGCLAYYNSANGINAGANATITGCTVNNNTGSGINASANETISGCTANSNTGSGIVTDIRASITGCTSIGNVADGIVFSGDSFILSNHASKNGGAGFHDIGSYSRIDGNVARENTGMGISAAPQDTVVRNNSGANGGVAYGPTAGANWGPVGNASSTNPWTNF
jgi:hypothetical protein